jgi:hypothetical protein
MMIDHLLAGHRHDRDDHYYADDRGRVAFAAGTNNVAGITAHPPS